MTSSAAMRYDDLGVPVRVPPGGARRIVSLVPSLTEAIEVTAPGRLVGATDWCIRPADLEVARVRGTKNPDLAAVAALAPDLVVANQEENRRIDVERLRDRGIPVWVTVTESVDGALGSMRRLVTDALRLDEPDWLFEAARMWAPAARTRLRPLRVAVPVWRDPWIVVGAPTYTGDLLERLGCTNVFAGPFSDADRRPSGSRYPHVELADIRAAADLVVLPDEPYAFGPDDGPECFSGADGSRPVDTVCVDGRSLTWYGPAMVGARQYLEQVLEPWTRS